MLKKIIVVAVALIASGFASLPSSNGGTEMLTDNSAPAPNYNYTPPRRVYYLPPPVPVVVYPAYAYCAPRVRVYSYHTYVGRRSYCPPHRRR